MKCLREKCLVTLLGAWTCRRSAEIAVDLILVVVHIKWKTLILYC